MTTNQTSDPSINLSLLPHDSLVPNIITCSVLTFVLATISVALRFYARGRVLHVLGPSDWCILSSWVCSLGVITSEINQAQHGLGRHVWDYDWETEVTPFSMAAWYGMLFYTLSLSLTKISIVLLYLNIFSYHRVRLAGKILLVIVILSTLWMASVIFTACIPLKAYWDWELRDDAFCQPSSLWWSNVGIHMTTDFLIFALPLSVLPTLRMPLRQKLILMMVFSLAFFVCIISIIRLSKLIHAETHRHIDFSYDGVSLVYWTAIEVYGAIICACIITLKPLLSLWMPRVFSVSGHRHNNNNNNNNSHSGGQDGIPLTIGQKSSRKKVNESNPETIFSDEHSNCVSNHPDDLEAGPAATLVPRPHSESESVQTAVDKYDTRSVV